MIAQVGVLRRCKAIPEGQQSCQSAVTVGSLLCGCGLFEGKRCFQEANRRRCLVVEVPGALVILRIAGLALTRVGAGRLQLHAYRANRLAPLALNLPEWWGAPDLRPVLDEFWKHSGNSKGVNCTLACEQEPSMGTEVVRVETRSKQEAAADSLPDGARTIAWVGATGSATTLLSTGALDGCLRSDLRHGRASTLMTLS